MLDAPDHSEPLNGSMDLERQSRGYPAFPTDLTGAADQETASTSGQSDDFSEIFDWDKYTSSEPTDVTTQSDVPSPGSSATTDSSREDDCPMLDVQPPHVWPRISGPHPPRDEDFHLDPSSPAEGQRGSPRPAQGPGTREMVSRGQPQPPSPTGQKRTRIIRDLMETNQVRDVRACYHCKMNKSKAGDLVVL
ncbi:hypothetical protein VTK56DRAFT_3346 [Thermocarpiscus australiensis]